MVLDIGLDREVQYRMCAPHFADTVDFCYRSPWICDGEFATLVEKV